MLALRLERAEAVAEGRPRLVRDDYARERDGRVAQRRDRGNPGGSGGRGRGCGRGAATRRHGGGRRPADALGRAVRPDRLDELVVAAHDRADREVRVRVREAAEAEHLGLGRVRPHPRERLGQRGGVFRLDDQPRAGELELARRLALFRHRPDHGSSGGEVRRQLARERHLADGCTLVDEEDVGGAQHRLVPAGGLGREERDVRDAELVRAPDERVVGVPVAREDDADRRLAERGGGV